MLKISSLNAYGTSCININGENVNIVTFSANIDEIGGGYSVSKDIANREAYSAHKDECDADFEAFETYVLESCPKDE